MNIGMPALIEFNSLEENVELATKLHLDFIELNMNFPYCMINNLKSDYIKNVAEKNNIYFTMHMPDDADIGSFYDNVRKGYVELLLDTIKWAKESSVKLINMHVYKGAYMTLPTGKIYINDKYSEEYIKTFMSSIDIAAKEAMKYDMQLNIENTSNFSLKYVQQIISQSLKYPNVKLTWDVGHDYLSGYEDKKVLLQHKESIRHMHLHDAHGKQDHMILGEGDINICDYVKFADENFLSVLVEVKSKEALEKSCSNLISIKNKNGVC